MGCTPLFGCVDVCVCVYVGLWNFMCVCTFWLHVDVGCVVMSTSTVHMSECVLVRVRV